MHGLEFIEIIEPTRENAKAMLRLTLRDLRAGGFTNPLSLADPSNEQMIIIQQAVYMLWEFGSLAYSHPRCDEHRG